MRKGILAKMLASLMALCLISIFLVFFFKKEKNREVNLPEREKTRLVKELSKAREEYDKMDDKARYQQEGPGIGARLKLGELAKTVLENYVDPGMKKGEVRALLGQSVTEGIDDQLWYYGEKRNWFFILEFENGKLKTWKHSLTFDIESGK